jgi:hypothetical protein
MGLRQAILCPTPLHISLHHAQTKPIHLVTKAVSRMSQRCLIFGISVVGFSYNHPGLSTRKTGCLMQRLRARSGRKMTDSLPSVSALTASTLSTVIPSRTAARYRPWSCTNNEIKSFKIRRFPLLAAIWSNEYTLGLTKVDDSTNGSQSRRCCSRSLCRLPESVLPALFRLCYLHCSLGVTV